MIKIQLITFKGCQSTVDFRKNLEEMINRENIDLEVEMVVIPSIKKAQEKELYGSPTILIDGREYQIERRGPLGFY